MDNEAEGGSLPRLEVLTLPIVLRVHSRHQLLQDDLKCVQTENRKKEYDRTNTENIFSQRILIVLINNTPAIYPKP